MDLIDPADPEYELKVAAAFQDAVNAPQPYDDIPVTFTARQVQKIAAIMGAVARGQDGFRDALRDASWVFDCAYAESLNNDAVRTSSTAAEAWGRVDAWPWPRPGAPRRQPE